MAPPCSQTPPYPSAPALTGGWLRRRINQSGSESGQALILTALVMTLVLVLSAFAIDLATWYQKHHQAQVAADAAALAAANCLANGKTATTSGGINCTSPTDTTDAKNVANQIATTNLATSTDQVQVDTISHTVTVTASATPQVDFAGLMSLHPKVSARSVASYSAPSAKYSVFVGNDTCNTGSGLQIASGGGGNATVTGLYSDGVIDNQDNSNSAVWSGGISDGSTTGGYQAGATPMCGNGQGVAGSSANNNSWLTKNTTVVPGQETAYPEQYKPPIVNSTTFTTDAQEPRNGSYTVTPGVCTFASTWFSTDGTGIHSLNWPGIYCVVDSSGQIATSYSGNCSWTPSTAPGADGTTGSIFVQSTLEGAFEFVGPCVVGAANGTNDPGISSNIQAISDPLSPTGSDPIVYGTAQTTPVTAPCLVPSTTFVDPTQIAYSPDNVYLYGNNLTLNGAIYAPCGTVEMNKNSAYNTFMEAANVTIDQNNFQSWAGTGPPSVPASDSLTS